MTRTTAMQRARDDDLATREIVRAWPCSIMRSDVGGEPRPADPRTVPDAS